MVHSPEVASIVLSGGDVFIGKLPCVLPSASMVMPPRSYMSWRWNPANGPVSQKPTLICIPQTTPTIPHLSQRINHHDYLPAPRAGHLNWPLPLATRITFDCCGNNEALLSVTFYVGGHDFTKCRISNRHSLCAPYSSYLSIANWWNVELTRAVGERSHAVLDLRAAPLSKKQLYSRAAVEHWSL